MFLTIGFNRTVKAREYTKVLEKKAVEFSDYTDVGYLVDNIKDERLVLLGESTHGTSQYYTMRAEISKKLIKKKSFSFVAVEGDWTAIYRLNLYVKGLYPDSEKGVEDIMKSFDRWPVWMWSNKETAEFVQWLKEYNSGKDIEEMVGFYGIDVYGHWDAMDRLLEYVRKNLSKEYENIKSKAECFTFFGKDEWSYARAVHRGHASCDSQLKDIVEILKNNKDYLSQKNEKQYFDAFQNALVVKNAENFYRLAVARGPDSWNSRANHFYTSVTRLLDFYGNNSRGIVWAHNTHVGDSRATSMDPRGMLNIGRLAREGLGRDAVFIAGFATNSGKVLAGRSWGSQVETMAIPQGIPSSLESKLSDIEYDRFYILFSEKYNQEDKIMQVVGHRAIGVVYSPENERGNYVPTVLPERYNALVFIKKTDALEMLD